MTLVTPAVSPSATPATPATEPPKHDGKLDRALVGGIAWTAGAKWVSQLFSWVSTLVVARLLTPEDYGLVGMGTMVMGLITMLSEFGMGSAVVTLTYLTPNQVAQMNSASVLFGIGGFVAACLLAVPLGWFFHAPQLPPVVAAMAVGFIITGFRTVPQSLLQRDLRFRRLAMADGTQALLFALATMTFAILGFRYWTLVLGSLISALTYTALLVAQRPTSFARPRFASIRPALHFSSHIIGQRLSWYVYSNADFFVAGKILGKAALGVYSFAWSLANVPIEKITSLVASVTPAVFANVQQDRAALRRYVLLLTEGLALLTFPATLGLAMVADDFVLLALGEKWRSMILPLRLLAFYASVRSITPLLPHVLNVTGETRFAMRNNVLAAILLPTAFFIGSRWGTVGIAAAWLVAHPLVIVPLTRRALQQAELPVSMYLRSLWPALSGTLVMAAAVMAARLLMPATWPLAARVAVEVGAGFVAYGLTILALHRARLRSFLQTLRTARG